MNPYLEDFYNTNCSPDVLPFFGNYKEGKTRNKEISESWGCFVAVRDFSGIDIKSENVLCVVPGDGQYPRTGSILAYMTSFNVVSIDPEMNMEFWNTHREYKEKLNRSIKRLDCYKTKVEEFRSVMTRVADTYEKVILVLPHSHANLKTCLSVIGVPCTVINLPCCVQFPNQLTYPWAVRKLGYQSYEDPNILSGKRKVHIWKGITANDVP